MARRSAGLLLWRRTPVGGVEVLLGHPGGPFYARRDDGCWTVPKGEHDPGEDDRVAAYREFVEEIGLAPPAGEPVPLGESRQPGGKTTVVLALEADLDVRGAVFGTFSLEWPPRSGRTQEFPEIDRVAWLDLDTARRKLWPSQVVFLDRLAALADGGG